MFTPSKKQIAIFDAIQNTDKNLNINACAGSGKTTTLKMAFDYIDEKYSCLFCAFNKSIVQELETKLPKRVNVNTLHSLGFRALRTAISGKISVNGDKVRSIVKDKANDWNLYEDYKDEAYDYISRVVQLTGFAKIYMVEMGDASRLEEIARHHAIVCSNGEIEKAFQVLQISNRRKNIVDFNDMLHFPMIFSDAITFKQYDFVFVDECQDLNIIQQELLLKHLKPNGRLISVGDPHQCIYGFAGSDINSFKKFSQYPNTLSLPLDMTYRCSKAVTKEAQNLVPSIHHTPDAAEGEVRQGSFKEITAKDFVLCRINAPLVKAFYELVKQQKPAYVKGKDIGAGIKRLISKTGENQVGPMFASLANMKLKLIQRIAKSGKDYQDHPAVINLEQKIEIFNIIQDRKRFTNVSNFLDELDRMFADRKNGICLSSIHKSKGLEADRVFILCSELLPAPFANEDWELEQENNIEYVAYTRAKNSLIFINDFDRSEGFTGDCNGGLLSVDIEMEKAIRKRS